MAGTKLKNSRTGEVLRPLKLVRVAADDYEDVRQVREYLIIMSLLRGKVSTGGIGAALGLKNTRTGDTLVGFQNAQVSFKGVQVDFCLSAPSLAHSISFLPPYFHARSSRRAQQAKRR